MNFFSRRQAVFLSLLAVSCVLPEQGGSNAGVDEAQLRHGSGGAQQAPTGGNANALGGAPETSGGAPLATGGASSTLSPSGGAPAFSGGSSNASTSDASGGASTVTGGASHVTSATGGAVSGGAVSTSEAAGGGSAEASGGASAAAVGGTTATQTTIALMATGGACPQDAGALGGATSIVPCGGPATNCGERFYPVGGNCVRPITYGYDTSINAEQDGGLSYDPTQSSFRMNQPPNRLLAFRLGQTFQPRTRIVALGAIADADPGDQLIGKFRLALYDSDEAGNPGQLVSQTTRELSALDPEECLEDVPLLEGGEYWLLLLVPRDQGGTVHLEATNISRQSAVVYFGSNAEYSWPSALDMTRLTACPSPPNDPTLQSVPRMYVRYLPSR